MAAKGKKKVTCQRYTNENRLAKNKSRKLKKHILRFPDDKLAVTKYEMSPFK